MGDYGVNYLSSLAVMDEIIEIDMMKMFFEKLPQSAITQKWVWDFIILSNPSYNSQFKTANGI